MYTYIYLTFICIHIYITIVTATAKEVHYVGMPDSLHKLNFILEIALHLLVTKLKHHGRYSLDSNPDVPPAASAHFPKRPMTKSSQNL